jgi:hypothetical protein
MVGVPAGERLLAERCGERRGELRLREERRFVERRGELRLREERRFVERRLLLFGLFFLKRAERRGIVY